jgi:hypothetical protein
MGDSQVADDEFFAQYLNYSDPGTNVGEADHKHIERSSPGPRHQSSIYLKVTDYTSL